MTLICAGAFVAGVLVAPLLSFLPFAASLTAALVIGIVVSTVRGMTFGETALPALAILVACQVGYGLCLIAIATLCGLRQKRRRWRASETASVERIRASQK